VKEVFGFLVRLFLSKCILSGRLYGVSRDLQIELLPFAFDQHPEGYALPFPGI
jgi:hypothetical protein